MNDFQPVSTAHLHDLGQYHATTEAWQSANEKPPVLRGRRLDRGRTMLHLLHGNGFCGGVYWPFLRPLVEHYDLFCHDIEGHGDSDSPAAYSGGSAVVRRIPDVITEQALPTDRLIGVGHSYGGALTLHAAANHPDLFRAIVLLDPILMPPLTWSAARIASLLGRNPLANGTLKRRTRWRSESDVMERLRGRGMFKGWTEESLACFAHFATHDEGSERVLSCPPRIEAAIFRAPLFAWRALLQVRCPVLFYYGRRSYPFVGQTAAVAPYLNRCIEIQRHDGGHCFMLEDPAGAASTVLAWLDQHQG